MAELNGVNPAQSILIFALRVYRILVSPILTGLFGPQGLGCRFTPTCSCYALEAVRLHGAIRGSALSMRRLCRCHPWGGCGDDPVPPRAPSHLRERLGFTSLLILILILILIPPWVRRPRLGLRLRLGFRELAWRTLRPNAAQAWAKTPSPRTP